MHVYIQRGARISGGGELTVQGFAHYMDLFHRFEILKNEKK